MSTKIQALADLLEKHEIIKVQFNGFDFLYRINDVSANVVAYTRHGPLSEFTFDWPQILCEIAYALEEPIKNNELYGANIALVIPEHIEIVNKAGRDLRKEPGYSYQFIVQLNADS